jgi:hypothetical protein
MATGVHKVGGTFSGRFDQLAEGAEEFFATGVIPAIGPTAPAKRVRGSVGWLVFSAAELYFQNARQFGDK